MSCANLSDLFDNFGKLMKTLVFNEARALAEVERGLLNDDGACRHVAARRRSAVPRRASFRVRGGELWARQ